MLSPLMCVKGMTTETTFSFIPKSLEKVIDTGLRLGLMKIGTKLTKRSFVNLFAYRLIIT